VSAAAISQGTLDGFCGIYALAHIVAIRSPKGHKPISKRLFFEILKALERSGSLTAKRIGSVSAAQIGFRAKLLGEAFNAVPSKYRANLQAIDFTAPRFQESEFCGRADLAFDCGCAFVVAVDAGAHWVATAGRSSEGRYHCYDPTPNSERTSFGKITWKEGLMVGPSKIVKAI
jgi:hypothetical protein